MFSAILVFLTTKKPPVCYSRQMHSRHSLFYCHCSSSGWNYRRLLQTTIVAKRSLAAGHYSVAMRVVVSSCYRCARAPLHYGTRAVTPTGANVLSIWSIDTDSSRTYAMGGGRPVLQSQIRHGRFKSSSSSLLRICSAPILRKIHRQQ